jgi:phthiocerol/phenolphthiocerol synthesis type-I polyketide synthase E
MRAEGVAIIGMALRVPGARDAESFWRNLRDGVEPRTELTDAHLDAAGVPRSLREQPGYVRAGFVLDGVADFDAAFFGYSPREAETMDPQHRLFLECAWEALERTGHDSTRSPGAISVFAGEGRSAYLASNLLTRQDLVSALGYFALMVGNEKDYLATRVSHRLDLRGPSLTVQTACSTSLVAVHQACQSLLTGESNLALAGGVSLQLPQGAGYLHQEGGILSPDGHCRPFDEQGAGTVAGSGVAVVVLKRLADALEDGDTIHAVIRGTAVNNDGASKVGYTAPSVDGQAHVISEALAVAGVEPGSIQYVEAHGTATPLGDPIEVAALNQVFQGLERESIALGSLKSNLGHMDAAAGVAGLIKAALALEHRQLPPSLHFQKPNPRIPFEDGPFHVNASLRDWPETDGPRRAAVSSFGIGGTNAHAVLEEAPAPASRTASARPWQLLALSARSAPALEEATENLATHLERHPEVNLADVAYTLQVGRRRFEHRRVLVCRDVQEAREALKARRMLSEVGDGSRRSVAFLIPGQGAQHVDMGRGLYESEPLFRQHMDACCERLAPHLGEDLRKLLYPTASQREEAARRLEQTAIAQPALFTLDYALARWWMDAGVQPRALLGHSLGQYVAACLAGVFSLEDALALVALRGQLLQRLPTGSMLSVSLPEAELRALLAGRPLDLAAINAPGLSVASGPTEAVQALQEELGRRGVECRRLHTSHANHSAMVEPMMAPLAERLGRMRLSAPSIPCISNLTGTWMTDAEATDPRAWAEHLRRPVRFSAGVATLLTEPDRVLLEVGPGQALTMLARQAPEAAGRTLVASMRRPQDERPDVPVLLDAAGRLWLAGVELKGEKLQGPGERRRTRLPTYPFQRERYWVEPGTGMAPGASAPAASGRKREDVSQWFHQPAWKPTPPLSVPALERGTGVLAFVDEGGPGARLVERLRAQGAEVVSVVPAEGFSRLGEGTYGLAPGEPGGYQTLVEELAAAGRLPGRVVHLWNLGPEAGGGEDAALATTLERALYSPLFLARALKPHAARSPVEVVLAVSGALEVTGGEARVPARATVLGPCRVVPQEEPGLRLRCVDVEVPTSTAQEARWVERLVEEVRLPAGEPVVAWRGARRYVEHFEPTPLPAPGPEVAPLRERGVYLLTGGLGRIGLGLAEHLAAAVKARLVLVGRSPFPAREEWDAWVAGHGESDAVSRKIHRLREMERLGAEVLVLRADVSRREQLASVLARAEERFGTVHGVVHSAGSIGAQTHVPLEQLERAHCEEQLAAKVHGTRWLEAALSERTLDFVVLQSSLSTVLGGAGFTAYAAANAFQDAFAARRTREGGTPWLSIDWDGWRDGEDGPAGLDMTLAEGSDALRRLLAARAEGRWVVSTADLPARLAVWQRREASAPGAKQQAAAPGGQGHARPALRNEYVAPRDAIEREVAAIWQELLGVAQPGIHDDFFELGGHSLVGSQVVARVCKAFEVELSLRALFETPTIAGMATAIVQSRADKLGDEELESLLAELT